MGKVSKKRSVSVTSVTARQRSGLRCTICDHPERAAIDAALAVSSERTIANQWLVSRSAVNRHRRLHVAAAVARVVTSREDLGATALVEKLLGYVEAAEAGIKRAQDDGDLTGLARCIKEAHSIVLSLGKTIGVWSDRPQIVNDNRRQTLVNMAPLSTEELRSLARLAGDAEIRDVEYRALPE